MTYPYPVPSIVQKDANGNVIDVRRLRFVNVRSLPPVKIERQR